MENMLMKYTVDIELGGVSLKPFSWADAHVVYECMENLFDEYKSVGDKIFFSQLACDAFREFIDIAKDTIVYGKSNEFLATWEQYVEMSRLSYIIFTNSFRNEYTLKILIEPKGWRIHE